MEEQKPNSEIILYQTEDGKTKIEVRLENETVWLTQAQICELFQKAKSTISEHISNIFEEGELNENSVVRNFRTTQIENKRSVFRDVKLVTIGEGTSEIQKLVISRELLK